jgi:predicted short-subunit dehydrogenase-like oxidoreductase (DUF2520 family)
MGGQGNDADIAIIGAGRVGHGLALALTKRGRKPALLRRDWIPAAVREAAVVLLAVPNDSITPLAAALADRQAVHDGQVVLHLSGLLDRGALEPLAATGAARGSFHPLQTISDPATAPERLDGAYAGIEGDDRALQAGRDLAIALGMKVVEIPAQAKPAYHAAASIVSNYTVTLLGIAERLAMEAGIPREAAAKIYLPLLQGTLANLEAASPSAALTGPIRRGDLQTLRAHFAALAPADRKLYRDLALATLELAVQAGLDEAKAAKIEQLLTETA